MTGELQRVVVPLSLHHQPLDFAEQRPATSRGGCPPLLECQVPKDREYCGGRQTPSTVRAGGHGREKPAMENPGFPATSYG